jgi:hypothetical protein
MLQKDVEADADADEDLGEPDLKLTSNTFVIFSPRILTRQATALIHDFQAQHIDSL